VDLYIHSSICLHDIVLNLLSTRTTLPYPLIQTIKCVASEYVCNPDLWKVCSCLFLYHTDTYLKVRAVAQAVSCWLPTVAAWVRAQVRSCGICGGQSGTGAGFLLVLWFHLPILIPLIAPHSSSIIQGWYNRPDSD
jgi:hypothetical protein